jgi:N-acetylmuramoyl-L-alanine amidase
MALTVFLRIAKKFLLVACCIILACVLVGFSGFEDLAAAPLKIIVIDPGHGGDDKGATGLSGLQEKDLCLALASQLADTLRQRLGVRVILTRNDDTAVGLYERTAIANHQRADLFISLHFNADLSGQQQGMKIYTLSGHSNKNEINAPGSADEADIWEQAQAEILDESRQLALSLYQQAIELSHTGRVRLCSAPLFLLEGASMPAVLVELAYLSNPQEEEELWIQEYKNALVNLVYLGILNYAKTSATNKDG